MSRVPISTLTLAAALTAVFAWQVGLDPYRDMQVVLALGVVPANLWGLQAPAPGLQMVPAAATLLTAQGLHGGIGHLAGNLTALLFVGPPAEGRTGAWRTLAVFLVAGAAGLAVEAAATPTSTIPILGASASVAGLIGAVMRRNPQARVRLALPSRQPAGGIGLRRLTVPVLPLVATWLAFQVAGIAFEQGEPVAFLAHVAGFLAGALLAGSGGAGTDGPLRDIGGRG